MNMNAKNKSKVANSIHFAFQSKGGCGKTFVSALLAQFLIKIGLDIRGFDTDQENRDFYAYKSLPVQYVDVMEGSTTIDQKKFDCFMEALLTEEGTFVVDNGANSFTPLLGYLVENNGIEMLLESGKNVYLHGIVAGGDNYDSTVIGFLDLVTNANAPVVLWLNEHFGELKDAKGVPFLESIEFKAHEEKICGVIMLQKTNPQTYGKDLIKMTKARLTFDQVMESADYVIMEKQRLRLYAKGIFEQLAKVNF
jgi:hypothetical protein